MKTATVTPLAVLQPASDSVKVPVCALSYSILAMTLRGWWWSWGLDGPIFLMRKLRPRGGKRLVQGDEGKSGTIETWALCLEFSLGTNQRHCLPEAGPR